MLFPLLEAYRGLPAEYTEIFIQKVTTSIFFSKNRIFSPMVFKSGQHVLASVYGSCDTSLKSLLWEGEREEGKDSISNRCIHACFLVWIICVYVCE